MIAKKANTAYINIESSEKDSPLRISTRRLTGCTDLIITCIIHRVRVPIVPKSEILQWGGGNFFNSTTVL